MSYLRAIVILLIAYLAMTGSLQPSNLIVGLLLAAAIAWLLHPRLEPVRMRYLPVALWALARYVLWLAYDILRNGLMVARIVLQPEMPVRPGIVALQSRCKSEWSTAACAHSITVTPGEMVIEIGRQGVLYVHCLNVATHDRTIKRTQRLRESMLTKILS